MNCHESRTVLDAVFPGTGVAGGLDFEQAADHARSCSECSNWLQAAHAFDRWVAPAFRDVQAPQGLRERLLQSIDVAQVAVVAQPAVASTRRLWIAGLSAAVIAIAAISWWKSSSVPVEVTSLQLADVESRLDLQAAALDSLSAFDGSFSPQLPGGWNRRVQGSPLGIDLNGSGGHDAAVYRFTSGPHSGYLIVTAADLVSDPPEITIPHSSHASYPMRRVTWTSGNQVCICYLDASGPRLDEFLSDLYPQSA